MKILVFDTETTSLDKPFVYNIGYVVYDTETGKIDLAEDFVIEQVWHNLPLFQSAYYANKRPLYVSRMKAKKVHMEKYGYVTQRICRIIKNYNIECAYAYNSSFDEKVFSYNCDWFKTINPFELIPVYDIRGLVHQSIAKTDFFKNFCEENGRFTETGNYSTTAETLFQYITGETNFEEEHTALSDSRIELDILIHCVDTYGMDYAREYKTLRSVERRSKKSLTIYDKELQDTIFECEYFKIRQKKNDEGIVITIQ